MSTIIDRFYDITKIHTESYNFPQVLAEWLNLSKVLPSLQVGISFSALKELNAEVVRERHTRDVKVSKTIMVFENRDLPITVQESKHVIYTLENDAAFQRMPSFDPANKISLSWHSINVFVKPKKKRFPCFGNKSDEVTPKQLLHGVHGEAKPGQLLAIMGASGAGKTTLLNVLTNRNVRRLDIEGEVLVNGQNVGKSISRLSAYVQQDDLFIGTLKVREHLIFQALLRMDQDISLEDRMRRVEEVIAELGLSKCADTMIGVAGKIKGISGGEAKRLAFAAEVLTNPALMFCDEPTSGLDSFMAQSVVSVLRDMAEGGRTIVCTIHQPSSETFELFDHLLLLAEGRVAFRGKSSNALAFFERAGLRCPINYNPADFYVHNLAIVPGKEKESKEKVSAIWTLFARESKTIETTLSSKHSFTDTEIQASTRYKASWWAQFRAVMWRSWISMIRDPMTTKVRFIQSIFLSVLLGVMYLKLDIDQVGIMNVNGAFFILLMNTTFSNMMTVINSFPLEQPIFLREHWNGMYRTDVYFLCKTLAEAPILSTASIIFTCIMYWMVGFNKDYKAFLLCLAIILLVANTSASFGYMVSCMSSSLNVALSVSVPLLMPLVLFGGFYLNAGSIPVYFIWLKYCSWIYYGNEALLVNQWRDITNISCSTNKCLNNGTEVLEELNFKEENISLDIGLIAVLLVVFRIIAFLALLRKSTRKT